jgi:hypothetical protein
VGNDEHVAGLELGAGDQRRQVVAGAYLGQALERDGV